MSHQYGRSSRKRYCHFKSCWSEGRVTLCAFREFQEKATLFRNLRWLTAPRLKPRTQRLCRVRCMGHQLSFTCENMHDIFPPVTAKEAKHADFPTRAPASAMQPYCLCGGKLGPFLRSSSLLGSSLFWLPLGEGACAILGLCTPEQSRKQDEQLIK